MEHGMSVMTYAKAITDGLRLELRRDPRVLLFGEDIGPAGGVYGITKGLVDEFGHERIVDTPISEAGFVGLATGAAIAGLRPVVELMFSDFALVAGDQLLNQAAKMRMLSGNKLDVPLTIRTQQGISGGGGAHHSQSLEALFAHIPGFAVAMPSSAADAKGLLATAIRSDQPTIFIEHKGLYFTEKGEVPDGEYTVPFGQARVARAGTDLTIVSYSRGVQYAVAAAEQLLEHGIDAEVIDLRTIVPVDWPTVLASVEKTGRALVVYEAHRNTGFGAELAATISERAWGSLRAPVGRVAGLDIPVPYAKPLEDAWIPNPGRIVDAVLKDAVTSH
jgi:pyruvate/2-oxoglutarate/acetoin dehydrogenase E1 component